MFARSVRPAAVLAACIACAFLVYGMYRQSLESMDFRYIWLAGEVWSQGGNPYGPTYLVLGNAIFPGGYAIASWVYPFHWYVPAVAVSLLSPETGFALWMALSLIGLAGAGWLVHRAAVASGVRLHATEGLLWIAFVATGSIAGYAVKTGQPAVLAEIGVAILACGLVRGNRLVTGIGLCLAMLKPQIGIPFAIVVLMSPGNILSCVIGAALTALASLPVLLSGNAAQQLTGLIRASTGSYQQVSYNSPEMMSGLPHLIFLATGRQMGILTSVLIATVACAGVALIVRRLPQRERLARLVPLACAASAAIIGLHTYDLVLILFCIPFLPALSLAPRLVAMFGFALLWRAEVLAMTLHGAPTFMPTIQTAGLWLVFVSFLAYLLARMPLGRPSDPIGAA